MKRDPPSRLRERDGLSNDLARLRDVYEHEARRHEVEGITRQFRGSSVSAQYLHVAQAAFIDHRTREIDGILAPLDAYDASRGSNALGEKFEASVRAAADLNDARTLEIAELIKQPARLMSQLLRLPLQPLLFRLSIAKYVLVGFGHDGAPLI